MTLLRKNGETEPLLPNAEGVLTFMDGEWNNTPHMNAHAM